MSSFMPMNEEVLNASLALFSKVSVLITSLVGAVFVVRVSLLVASIARPEEYGELLKGTILYFGLINLFPTLIKIIISTTSGLAQKVIFIPAPEVQDQVSQFFERMFGEYALLKVFGSIGDLLVMGLANGFYSACLSLLLSIAPIIIFLNTIFGLSHGIKTYFSVFIALSLWPLLWNILGALGQELLSGIGESPVSVVTFRMIIQCLQFLSPVFCVVLFKSLSASSVVSGPLVKGAKMAGGKWI